MNLSVVILAAGKGTRMDIPDTPKVLVELKGKPLLEHVLDTVEKLESKKTVLIIGYEKQKVLDFLDSKNYSNIVTALQEDQLGTGHAVDQARSQLAGTNSDVMILCGDVPLLTESTLKEFMKFHRDNNSDLTVLSAIVDDPSGYGRVIRDENGDFRKIVEHKDSTEEELEVNEINSGTYIVNSKYLFNALDNISNKNAQGEYYLTDIVEIIKEKGGSISAYPIKNEAEIQGINSVDDLKKAESFLNDSDKPYKILGIQQVAIGGLEKSKHLNLWQDLFGLEKKGEYKSEKENVDEDILTIGKDLAEVEIDIMQPIDADKKPAVHSPPLNHLGLWVDSLSNCYNYLESKGVRFTPGGIRKGASGHDVCFIHPKGNDEFPISGEGILIELVQAPKEIIDKFNSL